MWKQPREENQITYSSVWIFRSRIRSLIFYQRAIETPGLKLAYMEADRAYSPYPAAP